MVKVVCTFVFKRNLSILVSDRTDLFEEEWLKVQKKKYELQFIR